MRKVDSYRVIHQGKIRGVGFDKVEANQMKAELKGTYDNPVIVEQAHEHNGEIYWKEVMV